MIVHIYFDGAARQNPGPAAGAAVLLTPDGETVTHRAEALGQATNNDAEWHGLLLGLRAAREVGATDVVVHGDSKLVLNSAFGTWSVGAKFLASFNEAKELASGFQSLESKYVPRIENGAADHLCNQVLDGTYAPFGAEPVEARVDLNFVVALRVSKEKSGGGAAIRKEIERQLQSQFPLAGVKVVRL